MEAQLTNNNLYPGMGCNGIEIFNQEGDVKIIMNGRIKPFSEASFQVISILNEQVEKEPESKAILEEWHPNSPTKQIKQFAACRFGGLDFKADILNNQLQDGEYHPCPHRGVCPAAGILCKSPMYNGKRLTPMYVNLMIQLSSTATNLVIAESLSLCIGTFHLIKKNLYELLGVQTKQEVALIARDLNLV